MEKKFYTKTIGLTKLVYLPLKRSHLALNMIALSDRATEMLIRMKD